MLFSPALLRLHVSTEALNDPGVGGSTPLLSVGGAKVRVTAAGTCGEGAVSGVGRDTFSLLHTVPFLM